MDLKRYFRGPFVAVLVMLLVFFVVYEYASSGNAYTQTDTSRVVSLIENGQVKSALLTDKEQTIQITTKSGQKYEASWVGNEGQQLAQLLQTKQPPQGWNVNVPKSSSVWSLIFSWLPFLLVILIFFFMLNQMQGGGSRVMNFGKSKAKLITKDTPKTTFADVAGADEAIEELQEIKEFLQNPAKFQAIGAKIPKGVLLYGPPGTGKTLLARAVAGEAGVPFYSISGSDFVEMFVGVGASRVRDLFEQAKANAPAIVFVDEIDAVGRHRGAGFGGGHDEREQTLNQLLVELDGFDVKGGVIVIAATNRPDILDPALLRPGRFDRQIVVAQPDLTGRRGILKVHARGKPFAPDVDLDIIARRTAGFTGADLANVINEGALLTARHNGTLITMASLEESIDRVMAGPERKSVLLSESERKIIAYHEGGHALVGHALPNADPVHKITIIPRGRALGYTASAPAGRQVPGHPLGDDGPAGHAARRPDRGGAGLPRAHHRRGQRHREGQLGGPGHGHRVRHERAARGAQVRHRGRRAVPRPRDVAHPRLLRGDRLHHRRGSAPSHRVRARRGVGDPGHLPGGPGRPGPEPDGQGDAEPQRGTARSSRPIKTRPDPRLLHRLRQAAPVGPPAGPHAQGTGPHGRGGGQRPSVRGQRAGQPARRRPGILPEPAAERRPGAGRHLRREPLSTDFDAPRIERAVQEILLAIGEDPERDGLRDTPARVARAFAEQFSGLGQRAEDVLTTVFDADHDELVLVRDIEVYSTCEHHLVPFFGAAHIGYIPNEKGQITGLSKLARLVDVYARRPQVQERMTTQIADGLMNVLEPRGVLVVIEAEHLCMSMRGVRKPGAKTVTSAVRGIIRESQSTRMEAMSLLFGRRANG